MNMENVSARLSSGETERTPVGAAPGILSRLSVGQARIAAIMAGGAVGTLARAGLAEAVPHRPGSGRGRRSWSTSLGALILGWLLTRLAERTAPTRYWRFFTGTGFCGALTTFSTFQIETFEFARDGHVVLAVGYPVVSIVAGMALAIAGVAARTLGAALVGVLTWVGVAVFGALGAVARFRRRLGGVGALPERLPARDAGREPHGLVRARRAASEPRVPHRRRVRARHRVHGRLHDVLHLDGGERAARRGRGSWPGCCATCGCRCCSGSPSPRRASTSGRRSHDQRGPEARRLLRRVADQRPPHGERGADGLLRPPRAGGRGALPRHRGVRDRPPHPHRALPRHLHRPAAGRRGDRHPRADRGRPARGPRARRQGARHDRALAPGGRRRRPRPRSSPTGAGPPAA